VAADLTVEPLDTRRHDRGAFACGVEPLDRYLKTQASQDLKRGANAVFVLVSPERPAAIVGYFTLCASSLTQGEVPEAARKLVSRYPLVSATLLGWLAVARAHQGQGLGGMLLERALSKAYEATAYVASCMVVVDAIDDHAARFYEAFGFTRLPESKRLVLPMQTIANLPGAVAARLAAEAKAQPAPGGGKATTSAWRPVAAAPSGAAGGGRHASRPVSMASARRWVDTPPPEAPRRAPGRNGRWTAS
jgi:GNAT superfamily N-acetyltransferase